MNLLFLRHGKAHPRGPKWRPDSRRPLTPEGEEDMVDVGRGMKALGISLDVILASPYVRALRTAEILAEVYDTQKVFPTRSLAPEAGPNEIIEEINKNFAAAAEIVLVGHEPSMTRLISTLLCGEETMAIELKKAGLCQLSVEKLALCRCARLHWLMTPKQAKKAKG